MNTEYRNLREQDSSNTSSFLNEKQENIVLLNTPTQSDILLEVIQKLSRAADLETIMLIVRRAARKLTDADGATFVLREGDNCFYADEDAIAPLWKGKRFPMSTCISGWVITHGRNVIIEDIYTDDRIPHDAYKPTFVNSMAMVPIRMASPIGAIGTYWADRHSPTDEEVNLLQTLAEYTSLSIENIQLHTQLVQSAKETSTQHEITIKLAETNKALENTINEYNRRNTELQWLKELSSILQSCVNLEEAYKVIAPYITKLLHDSSGTLYLMNTSHQCLEAKMSWENPILEEKVIKHDDCLALRRGTIFKAENPQTGLVCAHHDSTNNIRPYTCTPLFAQGEILGLIYLEWKSCNIQNPEEVHKKQEVIIGMLAEQIALGLSNIKLRETIRHFSFKEADAALYQAKKAGRNRTEQFNKTKP